ncbi:MAG: hypothetical protein V2A62_05640 [Candidatus Woesearchaeota archaeon]
MNRKADASMWWIIIGAVIALVVLIILMIIFTGKTNKLEGGLSDCQGKGGVCVTAGSACPMYTLESSAFSCSTNSGSDKCCLGSPKKCTTPGSTTECGDGVCSQRPGSNSGKDNICFLGTQ